MKVQVCKWRTCTERFSEYIATRLENDKKLYNCDSVVIEESKCMGNCKCWPNIKVDWKMESYMTPARASEIVRTKQKHIQHQKSQKKPK
jgi:NADH:ubiquinone oxidoreductase subunit E